MDSEEENFVLSNIKTLPLQGDAPIKNFLSIHAPNPL